MGTPGLVDTRTGTIRWAVNLDWQDLPLGGLLHERYGLPANVANDSQAAALAEYTFGAEGRRLPNLITIKVGRGIGAGLVLNGSLFQGDGFGAGEIGHVAVVDDGAACRCGRFGCLETVASSRAIAARAASLAQELGTPLAALAEATDELSIDDLVRAYLDGDVAARTAALEAARFLGQAVAGLIGALNISRIVLDGPVTAFGDEWLATVADEARRRSLDAAERRHGDRGRPAGAERRRPRRVGAADHPRARAQPRPMTTGARSASDPPRRRRRRRQQDRRARRRPRAPRPRPGTRSRRPSAPRTPPPTTSPKPSRPR